MKLLLSLCIIFCSNKLMAQQYAEPAVGIGNVKLGMPMKNILPLVGKPTAKIGYEEEVEKCKDSSYSGSIDVFYHISFDSIYVLDNNNSFGIWRIYSLHDTAVAIFLSRFPMNEKVIESISTVNGLHFYEDAVAIIKKLGADYIDGGGLNGYAAFMYPKKGLIIETNENKLCGMILYKGSTITPSLKTESCELENIMFAGQ